MIRVAEGTGGQVFLLDPSEVASSAALLMASTGLDQTLRRVVGSLDAGTHTIEVPVDSSVERVLFSVSLQCLQEIEIIRPSGAPVLAADPGVTWTAFQAGRQVGVDKPEVGTWLVRLSGERLLFMVVQARASLALEGVRLVHLAGGPAHEGYFDDQQPLVAGTTRLIEVRVSRGVVEPVLELRGSDDSTVGRLSAADPVTTDNEQIFVAEFDVPRVPFRLVVSGRDATGRAVQRTQSTLFQLNQPR